MANSVTYNTTTGETEFTVDQGSTFEHTFTFTVNTVPYDLTGSDARMQIRKTYGKTETIYNGTLANSKLEIVDAAAGVLKVIFAATDFVSVRFDAVDDSTLSCVFDLEVIDSLGKVRKPARGTLVLNREVTR